MAKLRALDAEVRAVGRVEINERAIHDVAPRFEGWIERLHVNASGDPVKRGQPLFPCIARNWSRPRRNWRLRAS